VAFLNKVEGRRINLSGDIATKERSNEVEVEMNYDIFLGCYSTCACLHIVH
jgi:hypothetical protein